MTVFRTNAIVRPALLRHVLGVAVLAALVLFASSPGSARTSLEKMNDLDVLELINDSKGKVMVINFFASWCGPCRLEIPELIEIREDFSGDAVTVVGIAVDDTEPALRRFSRDMGFNYPVYMGETSVSRLFNIEGVPMVLVYSPQGKLIDTQVGYRPGHVREIVEENLPQ
ncbi:TlpA family protein disulfide reductase [Oceanidesulfovibrio indonesiensis]|uniref:TlpA family protein disulfide reductase n=1 Tax=Oceanidesulfovibrio indonesiensis TaxID=54767 RepID=A0A7M3MGH7_9BACT|nr:TlpA disulfide reductase family protein [Oceanidesulfovibrio indonesiensis]TVM18426.1 TlpA family protein disulfide reductase [Oceanidesulfovibrio indonesiensis]